MKGLTLCEPMMKAWLEGRKTVTRRLMKPQPGFWVGEIPYRGNIGENNHDIEIKPPYHPGEAVYIKEAWGIASRMGYLVDPCLNYKADGKQVCIEPKVLIDNNYKHRDGWRSPRFMPDWASRSHALIKSVRPERLNSISQLDIVKEGVDTLITFMLLWDKIHKGGLIWEKNPWVWVITLERCP